MSPRPSRKLWIVVERVRRVIAVMALEIVDVGEGMANAKIPRATKNVTSVSLQNRLPTRSQRGGRPHDGMGIGGKQIAGVSAVGQQRVGELIAIARAEVCGNAGAAAGRQFPRPAAV